MFDRAATGSPRCWQASRPGSMDRHFGNPHSTLHDVCNVSSAVLGSSGVLYCAATAGSMTNPSALALSIIQPRVMSERTLLPKASTGSPPPTSLWTPVNQTCSSVLSRRRCGRPLSNRELEAPLVDRHGMIRILNVRVQRGIEEAVQQGIDQSDGGRYAERTDGVPHSEHRYLDLFQGTASQLGENRSAILFIPVSVESRVDQIVREGLGRQTAGRDHAGEASGRIRAAAESEYPNGVPGLVQVRYFCVAVFDFRPQTGPKGATQYFRHGKAVRTNSVVVEWYLIRSHTMDL